MTIDIVLYCHAVPVCSKVTSPRCSFGSLKSGPFSWPSEPVRSQESGQLKQVLDSYARAEIDAVNSNGHRGGHQGGSTGAITVEKM